ncbi:hypothetical protein Nepgr_017838 [Nepenthes gracilis]|uniref:Neprosin PEP catalytic domain-containing protein n=1 Tax=Nepenthes gracilis TaxID=150966 RepID=A0AAD3SRW4_NEPGR|nr:hypothetical protein Nepgr_017838 [Nepenthes gracilis]
MFKKASTMQAKFFTFVILSSVFYFNYPLAEARSIQARLANKPKGTIKTIKGDDGEVVDCVDIYKQPAFDHPLLKNHTLQMQPSSYASKVGEYNKLEQPWHKNGECPKGSIPIRRQVITGLPVMKKQFPNLKFAPPSANTNHQYAVIAYFYGSASLQGANATINIWNPTLENPNGDFSLTQIWISAGSGSSLNTIEAGWQVYPGRTGDSQPRFFIYWTADGYTSTGCYDLTCPGFVQTNNYYAIGMALQPSVYGGQQYELNESIQRDPATGNWWLYLWGTVVGYWPASIYNSITNGADTVEWGGEIYDSSGTGGFHTTTQMGSGHFPTEGYGKASYVRDLQCVDTYGNVISPPANSFQGIAPAPNCYNYQFQQGSSELYLFYGGPGCH